MLSTGWMIDNIDFSSLVIIWFDDSITVKLLSGVKSGRMITA
jgi:hypothetical protein